MLMINVVWNLILDAYKDMMIYKNIIYREL